MNIVETLLAYQYSKPLLIRPQNWLLYWMVRSTLDLISKMTLTNMELQDRTSPLPSTVEVVLSSEKIVLDHLMLVPHLVAALNLTILEEVPTLTRIAKNELTQLVLSTEALTKRIHQNVKRMVDEVGKLEGEQASRTQRLINQIMDQQLADASRK
ncbi:B2-like protein [Hubei unio douglasiae virus 1]|uniref:B2-like protein n=1 Tax=Hubei unio douglasiae virus 1 TaxID=1923321 RepID=UPI00090B86A7|nr:B2-like protein [Hubei unio douglasiae virus 1]APG76488.1 B2-like protein [Hubei unio douglasiae virus 1]